MGATGRATLRNTCSDPVGQPSAKELVKGCRVQGFRSFVFRVQELKV